MALLFVGSQAARAQTADTGEREASTPQKSTPVAEKRREHGRRHDDAGGKHETPAASESAAAPFPAQPAAKPDTSELVCKYDQLPGTKVKQKRCGTAEQWAAWRKKNQENVDEVTRKTRQGAGSIPRPDQSQRQMPPGGGL